MYCHGWSKIMSWSDISAILGIFSTMLASGELKEWDNTGCKLSTQLSSSAPFVHDTEWIQVEERISRQSCPTISLWMWC